VATADIEADVMVPARGISSRTLKKMALVHSRYLF